MVLLPPITTFVFIVFWV